MPQGKHSTLRKTPSLILSATPNRLTGSGTKAQVIRSNDAKVDRRDAEIEVVPDSEEERARQLSSKASGSGKEIIEISSDEEQEEYKDDNALEMPGSWSVAKTDEASSASVVVLPKSSVPPKSPTKYRPARRIIESSDSEDAEEPRELGDKNISSAKVASRLYPKLDSKGKSVFRSPKFAHYTDSDDSSTSPGHDEGILVLNEIPRKPKPVPLRSNKAGGSSTPSTPQRVIGTIFGPVNVTTIDVQLTPVSSLSPSKKQPRTSKKAEAEAKLERLKTYAKSRFADLNEAVFDNKIPYSTKLEWNNRLLTTAGKASYKRDRDGVVSKIELAVKVLDNEDRIDRTLSHEMCHLATWIISGKTDEQHGQIFKTWASKVEKICPGIEVSTTHNYEINYPWKWRCDHCSFIYGRHSKSINTDEKGCGACNAGRLVALFETPAKRNPGTPRSSRMAASKPRDSPSALVRSWSPTKPSTSRNDEEREIICIHDSDSESDKEDDDLVYLATKMASTNI
ncbi:SprT-like family-domain-containing protein [Rhodocollybia butyracea]|uniref:SprT-like family-domain-containing protein n=1 Tax=Rhodocollybia butyracea TaxID=206335 RepID=A0A9P5UC05_9AGAR|nr:SprT-like family-domain-containing protein [Rhodocollybia butyracea]